MICPTTVKIKEAFEKHPEGIRFEIIEATEASSLYVSLTSPQVDIAVWFHSYAFADSGCSVSVRTLTFHYVPNEKKDTVKKACIELSNRYKPLVFELCDDKIQTSMEIPHGIELNDIGEYCYALFYRISSDLIFAKNYLQFILYGHKG